MTQEGLAEAAGLDRTFISIVERDIQSPSVDTFIRICEALGIKPSTLMARIEQRYRPKKRRRRRTK
jgi:transcriptional regulator with XRE-family HTH domain